MNQFFGAVRLYLGIERNTTTHWEKWISGLGAFVGLGLVMVNARWSLGPEAGNGVATGLVVASMGASAVLLFAVPHGVLSQPWPLLGGHLISALIGVTCQRYLPPGLLAPALAVGMSVLVMYYLRCIHPPGGATALTVVIAPQWAELGYAYLLYPVLVNAVAILVVAVAFNLLFGWRRYPAHLARRRKLPPVRQADRIHELTHEDFSAAIQAMDSFMDITAEDLADLLELAKYHAETTAEHPAEIVAGHIYSNGKIGSLWSVRQVVDAADSDDPRKDVVIYKVLAGDGAWDTGMCTREAFRLWTRFEVVQKNGHWVKVNAASQ